MEGRFQPKVEDTLINGIKVKIIIPNNIKPENKNKIILNIHGGRFIMGSPTDRSIFLISQAMRLKAYCIDYQLAPEAKYPVALNECVAVYKYLVSVYDPSKIVGVSLSAGGTHMLSMLLKAQELHLPMIRAIALLSPATDISGNGDAAVSNDHRDVLGFKNQADKLFAKPFAGDVSLTDPLVSPIYGNYNSNFPATVIATATRDLFLSNSVHLYWKLRAVNVNAKLLVGEGMWHGYQSFPDIPEL